MAQAHSELLRQLHSRSRARLSNLASVENITAFGCTVVSITTRARSDGFIASVRNATARLSRLKLLFSNSLAPARQRRAVEHQRMLENEVVPNARTIAMLINPNYTPNSADVVGVQSAISLPVYEAL